MAPSELTPAVGLRSPALILNARRVITSRIVGHPTIILTLYSGWLLP